MANLSLLAASLVMALIGWGWLNAFTKGVYDFFSFLRKDAHLEETVSPSPDATMPATTPALPDEQALQEELDGLDAELDALLQEAESELDDLETEL
jgi:hypothetical protein